MIARSFPGRGRVCCRLRQKQAAAFLICVLLSALGIGPNRLLAATNMTPIIMTGWNLDVIIEKTAVGPPYTSYAAEVSPGEGNAFYQTDLPQYAWGLPPSGAFASLLGDNTIFQFQPYTADNALIMSSATGLTNGTLTLATPATYAKLAILAHSASVTNQ
ncbi:MAG: domain containing protein, partial [Pedosphaera sp.]|nr:domain containing protein [Pedosphaera sp.]